MDDQQPTPPDDIAAAGSPATPDALRSIVARHQRGRTRTLGILLAVALVAGPAAGWAIGQSGGGGQQVATGSSPDRSNTGGNAPAAANAPGGGSSSGVIAFPSSANAPKATHLFTRTTADGITIRAYRMDPPAPPANESSSTTAPSSTGKETLCPKPMTAQPGASGGEVGTVTGGGQPASEPPATAVNGAPPPCDPALPPICKAAPSVLSEVSSDAAVGQSFDPIDEKQPSDALSHLAVTGFGVPESAPATVVTVQTGPGVATVRLRLPDGATDQMAPSNGVAVLAHGGPQPPADGTVVEALDANGNVLQSMPVNQPGPQTAFACGVAGPNVARQVPVPAAPPTTR